MNLTFYEVVLELYLIDPQACETYPHSGHLGRHLTLWLQHLPQCLGELTLSLKVIWLQHIYLTFPHQWIWFFQQLLHDLFHHVLHTHITLLDSLLITMILLIFMALLMVVLSTTLWSILVLLVMLILIATLWKVWVVSPTWVVGTSIDLVISFLLSITYKINRFWVCSTYLNNVISTSKYFTPR